MQTCAFLKQDTIHMDDFANVSLLLNVIVLPMHRLCAFYCETSAKNKQEQTI